MNGGTPRSDCSGCQCISGYEGTLCNNNIDDCNPYPCQNNGTCIDLINSYICACMDGYNGTNCEKNFDLGNNYCD